MYVQAKKMVDISYKFLCWAVRESNGLRLVSGAIYIFVHHPKELFNTSPQIDSQHFKNINNFLRYLQRVKEKSALSQINLT